SANGQLLETRSVYRVTSVWANRAGGWVMVFCHDDHGRKPADKVPGESPYLSELKYLGQLYRVKPKGTNPPAAPEGREALDIEGKRFAKPPKGPTTSTWPAGLAGVIADKNYLDGFNYQNPGFVIESVDTFYYGGDTKALNEFLAKLAKVKGL